ncbi:hypothetical protein [uncultured Aeromicrobium sp.]|uniref:hypothetical protein n=1 Tax=uncultured Aeromicrobium sp. TaxID=337820 RepID=UPI0025F2EA9D|nr:hypothetical protein [uncultured Aeromicrobium sp.]
MTEPSDRRLRVRSPGRFSIIVVVSLALVIIGVQYGPQLLEHRKAAATASSAADAVGDFAGVTSAEVTVDHRFRSHRRVFRERLDGSGGPRGEITMDVVLASDITPEQLAKVLALTRSELADPALSRHAVKVNYTQLASERRVFDGWGVVQPLVARSDDELDRIAEYALDLPDGAWFDLDPDTFEQGQFVDAGPPLYDELLGLEAHEAFTVGARLDAAAADLLDEAVRLTDVAADALDGPTVLYLVGSNDTSVLTTTEPPGLNEALRQIAARVRQGGSEALDVSFEAERVWTIGGDPDGTVKATLRLSGDGDCANAHASVMDDADEIFDEQSIAHTIDVACRS